MHRWLARAYGPASSSARASMIACAFFFAHARNVTVTVRTCVHAYVRVRLHVCISDKNTPDSLDPVTPLPSQSLPLVHFSLSLSFSFFFVFLFPLALASQSERLQMRIGKSVSRVAGECSGRSDKRHGFALITILHRVREARASLSRVPLVPPLRGIRSLRGDT